jgi:hypothetical protein
MVCDVANYTHMKFGFFWGSLYQLLNPSQRIPLNLVVRGGFCYSTFAETSDTADDFEVPGDRLTAFTRVGLRFAGKEPVLYPELGLEASLWFEPQWRFGDRNYGFNDELDVNSHSDRYWAYLGLNYAWTNIGHQASFAVTAGGSSEVDRFSAWRLGGVLPLVSEFPLMMPGYYYQELTARKFVHLYGAYSFPLDAAHCFHFRLEAGTARGCYAA